jgi:hypothetical protein
MLVWKPVLICTQFMLVQPRLLQVDTLQEVEEVQVPRPNVTDVDTVVASGVAVQKLVIPNVLPARSHSLSWFISVCTLILLCTNTICTPPVSNALPTKSATSDAITTTKKIPFGMPIIFYLIIPSSLYYICDAVLHALEYIRPIVNSLKSDRNRATLKSDRDRFTTRISSWPVIWELTIWWGLTNTRTSTFDAICVFMRARGAPTQ